MEEKALELKLNDCVVQTIATFIAAFGFPAYNRILASSIMRKGLQKVCWKLNDYRSFKGLAKSLPDDVVLFHSFREKRTVTKQIAVTYLMLGIKYLTDE